MPTTYGSLMHFLKQNGDAEVSLITGMQYRFTVSHSACENVPKHLLSRPKIAIPVFEFKLCAKFNILMVDLIHRLLNGFRYKYCT